MPFVLNGYLQDPDSVMARFLYICPKHATNVEAYGIEGQQKWLREVKRRRCALMHLPSVGYSNPLDGSALSSLTSNAVVRLQIWRKSPLSYFTASKQITIAHAHTTKEATMMVKTGPCKWRRTAHSVQIGSVMTYGNINEAATI